MQAIARKLKMGDVSFLSTDEFWKDFTWMTIVICGGF